MRKAGANIWDGPSGTVSALWLISAAFFLGGLLGCVLAFRVSGSGSEYLALYLKQFLSSAGEGLLSPPPLLLSVWETVRWPLFVFGLSFTTLGLFGIPLVFGIRGFLLSFSVSSFVRMFGTPGAWMAFLVFGIPGCLALPVLFVLGAQGWLASRALATRLLGERKRTLPYGKIYFLRCGLCACVLCVCVCLESAAVPALVAGMAGLFQL